MSLLESGEMYLETILILSKSKSSVRAIDVVEYMGFSKPAVSRAMSRLRRDELIVTDENGHISLTEKGFSVAQKIYERHILLTRFLRLLGVDEKTASQDACKMEHDISDRTFEAIKAHVIDHGE